ncbi:MAG: TIGR04211 family SH3 domain-containing protein [Gammaproteobacteria bacterium]|nr:TIGR04211 family SH3 domain-containing protein [Gammaproteobacteria bacterium]
MYKYLVVIACLAASGQVLAKSKYISDELIVTIRTGQGNHTPIIKTIKSGDRIEILEETETGYSRIKTSDGTEGWIRTQFISDEPVAAQKLAKLQEKFNQLDDSNQALKKENKELKTDKTKAEETLAKLQTELASSQKELTHLGKVAANPLILDKENKDMHEKLTSMSTELEMLRNEHQVVKDRSRQNWFMAGAGVIILGMLIGLIIPKFRFKRKDRWEF